VNEISNEIIRENARKERREYDNEQKIIKIIKRMSKTSKFDYASQDGIIAEAELEWINKEEVIKILEKLEERKEVYKPIKSNYRVVKGKPKY
jgi:DNA replicative helicase MCM subunit Mcm2 (Cdc46/Mcm family)